MKIRTDFVTNSSSSSFITIIATKADGTIIKDTLESDGFPEDQIFFQDDLSEIVTAETENGEEILENIRSMYCNDCVDYQLDDAEKEHPLRAVKDLKELISIVIKEQVYGEILEGEFDVPLDTAIAVMSYDVQNGTYSSKQCFTESGEEIEPSVYPDFDEEDGDWE